MKGLDNPVVVTPTLTLPPQETVSQFVMPALHQSRSERDWIPAFAGMTALFPNYDTVSQRGRGIPRFPDEN